ncbi:MAG: LptA/OstA family protein, partial [Myxococcota bacterium]
VDALILGRVWPATDERPARLVVVVRSGHSGAERARHALDLPAPARRPEVIERLAAKILTGLGYEMPSEAPPGAVAAAGPVTSDSAGPAEDRGRGLDAAFDREGFDGDAPIEIKADEAEIVSRDHGRELLFQRNVHVTQANVTLRSERLEATYRRGESEPEKLVAHGDVLVDQGGRRARCDRAIYLRKDQRLTCSGRAELVQGCDVVRGDSIQFWLADDRARVQGAASIVIRPEGEAGAGCKEMGGRS